MIQFIQNKAQPYVPYVYLRLTDVTNMYTTMITLGYKPLFSATSQQTGKTKNFLPLAVVNTNEQRATEMLFITNIKASENLGSGILNFGDENYPYGLYDVKIYSNSSATNLDPVFASAHTYSCILNVETKASNESPFYTSYDDNDNNTNNVYITNQST